MTASPILTPPLSIGELPEDGIWIHSPVLCKEHFGVLGIAVYASEELAQSVFPDWDDPSIRASFEVVSIPFEDAREIAKNAYDEHGKPTVAVHLHTDSVSVPSLTHWID